MPKSVFTREHKAFVRRMVDERKKAELTQVELARAIGRSQSLVSKYETGERRLDQVETVAILLALGSDPADVIESVAQAFRGRGPNQRGKSARE